MTWEAGSRWVFQVGSGVEAPAGGHGVCAADPWSFMNNLADGWTILPDYLPQRHQDTKRAELNGTPLLRYLRSLLFTSSDPVFTEDSKDSKEDRLLA